MQALKEGRVRDSIAISDSSRFILKKAGVDDFYAINVPVGTQPMKLEFTDAMDPADVSTTWDERLVAATCPERKCARCIIDLTTDEPELTGVSVLYDLRNASYINIGRSL
jgi:hypothetical protein